MDMVEAGLYIFGGLLVTASFVTLLRFIASLFGEEKE